MMHRLSEDDRATLESAITVLDVLMGDTDGVGAASCPVHGPADFRAIRALQQVAGDNEGDTAACECREHSPAIDLIWQQRSEDIELGERVHEVEPDRDRLRALIVAGSVLAGEIDALVAAQGADQGSSPSNA